MGGRGGVIKLDFGGIPGGCGGILKVDVAGPGGFDVAGPGSLGGASDP